MPKVWHVWCLAGSISGSNKYIEISYIQKEIISDSPCQSIQRAIWCALARAVAELALHKDLEIFYRRKSGVSSLNISFQDQETASQHSEARYPPPPQHYYNEYYNENYEGKEWTMRNLIAGIIYAVRRRTGEAVANHDPPTLPNRNHVTNSKHGNGRSTVIGLFFSLFRP